MSIGEDLKKIHWHNVHTGKSFPKILTSDPFDYIKDKTKSNLRGVYESGWIFVEALNDYLYVKGTPLYVRRFLRNLLLGDNLKKYSVIEVETTNGKKRTISDEKSLKKYLEEDGVGIIVKGVNTTPDIDEDSIRREAEKLGSNVSKKGVPKYDYRGSLDFLKSKREEEKLNEKVNIYSKIDSIFDKSYLNVDTKNLTYKDAIELFGKENSPVFRVGNNVLGIKNENSISFWKMDDNYIIYENIVSKDNSNKLLEHLSFIKKNRLVDKIKIESKYLDKSIYAQLFLKYDIENDKNGKLVEAFLYDYNDIVIKLWKK